MSHLRPTLTNARPGSSIPDDTALYMICESIARRQGLIWGELKNDYGTCAIGAFFDDNPKAVLHCSLIDEVAAYNDSILPSVSRRERRNRVLGWLKWKLRVLAGMETKTEIKRVARHIKAHLVATKQKYPTHAK